MFRKINRKYRKLFEKSVKINNLPVNRMNNLSISQTAWKVYSVSPTPNNMIMQE